MKNTGNYKPNTSKGRKRGRKFLAFLLALTIAGSMTFPVGAFEENTEGQSGYAESTEQESSSDKFGSSDGTGSLRDANRGTDSGISGNSADGSVRKESGTETGTDTSSENETVGGQNASGTGNEDSEGETAFGAGNPAGSGQEDSEDQNSGSTGTEDEKQKNGRTADADHFYAELKEKNGTLKVSAEADTGTLPEGTELQVTRITEGNRTETAGEKLPSYEDVEEKLQENAEKGNRELVGFLAYDLTFTKDGTKVEPDGDADSVKVSMKWSDAAAPADADLSESEDVSVLHLENDAKNPADLTDAKVVDLTEHAEKLQKAGSKDTADTAEVTVDADEKITGAEITVGSFSVFTITWTKGGDGSDSGTRIGQVKVRYVDTNGLEVDTAETFSDDDLAKMAQTNGGVVDLSAWTNKTATVDGQTTTTSRITGYTFDHAAIGSRDGLTITGVKAEKNENDTQKVQTGTNIYSDVKVTTYKLYYTTDSAVNAGSNWTLYRDSASGQGDNNANIFLIYRKDGSSKAQSDPTQVTVHHVDSSGKQVADNTSAQYWFNSASTTYNNTWNGATGIIANNSNSTFPGLHTASGLTYSGTAFIGSSWSTKASPVSGSLFYKKDSSGVWHTGTGTRNGGNSTSNTVTNELKDGNNEPVLYTDLYYVYSGVKGVTVHFVDENGKEIAGGGYALTDSATFNASDKATSSAALTDGYTYKEARIGSSNGSVFTTIEYTKAGDRTWTSTVKNGENTVTASGLTDEVWLVYTKDSETKTFTVNYKYISTTGTASDAYYDNDTSKTTDTFRVTSGNTKQLVKDSTTGNWADIIHDGNVKRAAAGTGTEAQPLYYQSTHLGSVDGPEISSVDVDSDGNIVYRNSYSANLMPSEANPDRYTASAASGRSFVITKDEDGNLTLEDSRNGSFELNYANDSSGTDVGTAYTATYHGENETTEYKATVSNNAYILDVEAYIPSANTQIYQTYIDSTSGGRKIWIDNDIMYSGLFKVGVSDQVSTELGYNKQISNLSYEWTRIETKSDGTTTETVLNDANRKQTGDHWNVAGDAQHRTWVDIEADEGDDIWRTGTTVSYKVKLTYTDTDPSTNAATTYTLESEPVTVNYYGQLENGSFETPSNVDTRQWKQSDYLAAGGVWKTTGPEGGGQNRDIEIQSVKSGNSGVANYWRNGNLETNTAAKDTPVAKDGEHFAELNCEKAGALYQDVITHPNETLSYGFSHRARIPNNNRNNAQAGTFYDSMYLVIMPTSLAMTSGKNNTELTEQGDVNTPGTLVYFINEHGGYDTTKATSEEDRITYSDSENGILIRKISSDNFDWHDVSVANGYTAKGGLTRFFFVAGTTATNNNTEGNFIDDVFFSQSLPTPEGFNLTVTKTFTGLTQTQLAAMALNNNADHPFEFTITNTYTQSNVERSNDALENAKLRFTATPSGTSSYEFKAAAADSSGRDLFTGNDDNTGTARYSNGTLTLTWTFTKQTLPSGALDRTFRYTVAETNGSVSGLIQTPTYTLNGGAAQSGTSGTINVHQGDTARYAFSNDYKENAGDDSQIAVEKVFSGVTETTVNSLLNGENPFSITVKKTADSSGNEISGNQQPTITLTPSAGGSVKDANGSQTYDVSYFMAEDSATGKVTLTWIIRAPKAVDTSGLIGTAGIYQVSETNFTPTPQQSNGDNNTLNGVTVNGKNVTSDLSGSTITEGSIYVGKVGTTDYSPSLSVSRSSSVSTAASATLNTTTNLIIAKTSGGTYLVWTKETAGANLRQAILNQINTAFTDSAALDKVNFFSGENPGKLNYSASQHPGLAMTYNSTTGVLSFENETAVTGGSNWTWSQYYATDYTVSAGTSYSSGMTNTDREMRVENIYDPMIKIRKISSGDHSEDLAGAVFRLCKQQGGTVLYYTGENASNSSSWTSDSTKAKTYTTSLQDVSVNGETVQQAIVAIGALPRASSADGDTYYLEEVTAPDGYKKPAKPVSFKINSDGTAVIGDAEDAVDNSAAEVTFPDPYYQITVSNSIGTELPDTGGMGTRWFFLTGFAMIVFALAVLGIRYLRGIRAQSRSLQRSGRKRGDEK